MGQGDAQGNGGSAFARRGHGSAEVCERSPRFVTGCAVLRSLCLSAFQLLDGRRRPRDPRAGGGMSRTPTEEDAEGSQAGGGCTCQRGRRTPSLEPSPVLTLIQFGDSGRAKSKDDEAGEWW